MRRPGFLPLAAAAACFAVYFANVLSGAFAGGVFLSDVPEMLLLLASCVFFVIGILAREAAVAPDREDPTARDARIAAEKARK